MVFLHTLIVTYILTGDEERRKYALLEAGKVSILRRVIRQPARKKSLPIYFSKISKYCAFFKIGDLSLVQLNYHSGISVSSTGRVNTSASPKANADEAPFSAHG